MKLFFKWLKFERYYLKSKKKQIIYFLKYFQFLLKLLIKHKRLEDNFTNTNSKSFNQIAKISILFKNFKLSKNQILKLMDAYENLMTNSQTSIQLQLNYKLVLILKNYKSWLIEMDNFTFLKENFNQLFHNRTEINNLVQFPNLRPSIYFSLSLKDQAKYIFGKEKFVFKPDRHKYLKTKTQLLLYKRDHEIK